MTKNILIPPKNFMLFKFYFSELDTHIVEHHSDELVENGLQCEECDMYFYSAKVRFKTHVFWSQKINIFFVFF